MLAFKPEARRTWDESLETVMGYIKGEIHPVQIDDKNFFGLEDPEEIRAWLQLALDAPTGYIACDTETTGLFPRDGHVLGISLAYCRDHGVYILSDSVDEEIEYMMRELFTKKKVIFHNAKFDMEMVSRRFLTDPGTGKAPYKGTNWWKGGKVFDTVKLFKQYFNVFKFKKNYSIFLRLN